MFKKISGSKALKKVTDKVKVIFSSPDSLFSSQSILTPLYPKPIPSTDFNKKNIGKCIIIENWTVFSEKWR